MAKFFKLCSFAILFFDLVLGSLVHAVPYDYSFTNECLEKPLEPQYRGGLVVNPELNEGLNGWTTYGDANIQHRVSEDGNKFIVASGRNVSFDSFAQTFDLDKDKLYTFSAWLQVSDGDAHIAAVFQTQSSNETAGWTIARKGCWSMLKGGLIVNASGPAQLYFQSDNTKVDIWADSISLQPFTFEEWQSHQLESIEQFRKGKVKIRAVDDQGRVLANASVVIKQVCSSYRLGAAINQNILNNTAYQSWFRERFGLTVFENEMKWYSTEKTRGRENYSSADALMQFARANRITVRGHNIFWDDPKYQPSWVGGLAGNDLWAAANNRINSVVKRYSGQLVHWDVVNENMHFSFFESQFGNNASATFYQDTNRLDPQVLPFLNEFNTIEMPNDSVSTPAKYLQMIAQLRQQGYNGPLGIGLEGHFLQANLPYIRSAIDQLASARLPIWITELDVLSGPNQATFLDQILRELHAHAAVQGIVMWVGWTPQGCFRMCLTDNNFKNLATGDVVDRLIHELTGGAEGTTDSNGFFETSLYYGEYTVQINHPDNAVKSSSLHKLYVKEETKDTLRVTITV